MKIRKAVIPAADLGTRFLPATKVQPKEMLPIVEEAVAAGIEQVVIVTSQIKRAIEDHFDQRTLFLMAAEWHSSTRRRRHGASTATPRSCTLSRTN